ncbi:hypothetical protein BDV26DRAFT_260377 [Aspergillus bertholletiae]|uniref:Uncharacterized protein n=1 Tax=Aspergillus bertholletiae TaxID=1226010 RepID=A0A5N7BB47_9EURO|nr:hypothetical protein BDV26DRAFT_260377 [Aspergillus bertholletiae]
MKVPFVLLASLCANSALTMALPADQASADKAILILGDGTTKTIERKDLESHLNGIPLEPPTDNLPRSFKSDGFTGLQKRGDSQFIIPLPDQEFLGWDIAMSPITHANGADATVSIAAGQSVANSISVGTSFTATVEKWLQIGASINYQDTVTNTLTGTATMTIPKGRWGAIVSNPLTHRRRGYVFSGAPGKGQYEYFQADSFDRQSVTYQQAKLDWVRGVITSCLGDGYPLKMCNGQGELK